MRFSSDKLVPSTLSACVPIIVRYTWARERNKYSTEMYIRFVASLLFLIHARYAISYKNPIIPFANKISLETDVGNV